MRDILSQGADTGAKELLLLVRRSPTAACGFCVWPGRIECAGWVASTGIEAGPWVVRYSTPPPAAMAAADLLCWWLKQEARKRDAG